MRASRSTATSRAGRGLADRARRSRRLRVAGEPFGLVAGAGASAGVGFTVSLLVAPSTAHSSRRPRPASSPAPWARLPSRGWCSASSDGWQRRRIDALLGGAEPLLDLEFAVDPESDHIRGALDARVPWSSNSDVECPYGRRAEPEVRELLRDFPWHPLGVAAPAFADVHPHAELASLASEPPPIGALWEIHDRRLR